MEWSITLDDTSEKQETQRTQHEGSGIGSTPVGAFETIVELLDAYPSLPGRAPHSEAHQTRCTTTGINSTTKVAARCQAIMCAIQVKRCFLPKQPPTCSVMTRLVLGAASQITLLSGFEPVQMCSAHYPDPTGTSIGRILRKGVRSGVLCEV